MRLKIEKGSDGHGLALQGPHLHQRLPISYMDAAHLLFDLKAELNKNMVGKGAIDQVAHQRRQLANERKV